MRKVLFVGAFDTFHSNNRPQADAFEELGWEVTRFDYRSVVAKARRSAWFAKALWVFRYYPFPSFMRRWFFAEAGRRALASSLRSFVRGKRFDLVFISKVEELDHRVLDDLRNAGKVFYYFMDPLLTARRIDAREFAKRADVVSATGSGVVDYLSGFRARTVHLVQGIDPEQFKDVPKRPKKVHEVVFAGHANRERDEFVSFLRSKGINVTRYGLGTKNGPLYNDELMKEYARSVVVLNLARDKVGFSVRVFEAMASGSLLITNYVPDLELFFKKGVHLEWFKDERGAVRLIRKYRNNPALAGRIGKNGKELVFKEFTWKDQVERIIALVGGEW